MIGKPHRFGLHFRPETGGPEIPSVPGRFIYHVVQGFSRGEAARVFQKDLKAPFPDVLGAAERNVRGEHGDEERVTGQEFPVPEIQGHRMNSDEQFIVPGGRLLEFFKLENIW